MKKQNSKNKILNMKGNTGITLVALIITIIILLILAVVAINAVQDVGIVEHAKNATSEYEDAADKENTTLEGYLSTLEENLPGGNSGGSGMGKAEVGKIVEKNSTINGETYSSANPIIPAGFAPIDITGEHASSWKAASGPEVNKGLVITDNETQRDNNGNTIGNEFVWIPVSDINKMIMCQEHGGAVKLDERTLQCPTCGVDTKLAGKLYAKENMPGESYSEEISGQIYNAETMIFKEPITLPEEDNTKSITYYQEKFNAMAESVAKYGGFYVGRYETSLGGSIAQSKAGQPTMNNLNWKTMYENSEKYKQSGVISEMVWGCQWDAMMRFIGNRATQTNNVSHNFSASYLTGGTNYTQNNYNDIASNIYDLEGNVSEFTQEGTGIGIMGIPSPRGGNFKWDGSPSRRSIDIFPPVPQVNLGSRLTLYVEV